MSQPTITTVRTHRVIPDWLIIKQDAKEDLGTIPSFAAWASSISAQPWMNRAKRPGAETTTTASAHTIDIS